MTISSRPARRLIPHLLTALFCALPATQAQAGLVVEYLFDGNSQDTSGHNQHLSLFNGASLGAGRDGGGLVLDGVNDYARVSLANYALSRFTVEAWVKVASYDRNVHYVSLHQNAYVVLGDYGSGPISTWADGLNPISAGDSGPMEATPSLNQWHHLAYSYDGAFQHIFLDGVLQKSLATTGTLTNNSSTFNMGLTIGARYSNNTQYVSGAIDSVRIHDTALTASQLGFFNDGHAVPAPAPLGLIFAGLLGLGWSRRAGRPA